MAWLLLGASLRWVHDQPTQSAALSALDATRSPAAHAASRRVSLSFLSSSSWDYGDGSYGPIASFLGVHAAEDYTAYGHTVITPGARATLSPTAIKSTLIPSLRTSFLGRGALLFAREKKERLKLPADSSNPSIRQPGKRQDGDHIPVIDWPVPALLCTTSTGPSTALPRSYACPPTSLLVLPQHWFSLRVSGIVVPPSVARGSTQRGLFFSPGRDNG